MFVIWAQTALDGTLFQKVLPLCVCQGIHSLFEKYHLTKSPGKGKLTERTKQKNVTETLRMPGVSELLCRHLRILVRDGASMMVSLEKEAGGHNDKLWVNHFKVYWD